MIYLWFNVPSFNKQLMRIEGGDIYCYWIHSGTWGSYRPPNNIYICPWQIEKTGGFERLLRHEITHLRYYDMTKNMTHEERENFINKSTE